MIHVHPALFQSTFPKSPLVQPRSPGHGATIPALQSAHAAFGTLLLWVSLVLIVSATCRETKLYYTRHLTIPDEDVGSG